MTRGLPDLTDAVDAYVLALVAAGPRDRTEISNAVHELVRTAGERNPLTEVPGLDRERAAGLARDLLETVGARAGSGGHQGQVSVGALVALDRALDEAMENDATWDVGEQVVAYSWLVEGRVLTRRLTAEECERDALVLAVDLELLDAGPVGALTTADGQPVRYETPEPAGTSGENSRLGGSLLVGPAGWLAGYSAGDLVGVDRRGSELTLTKVAGAGEGRAEGEALAAAFDAEAVEGVGLEPLTLVIAAISADGSLFRTPVLPVRELLERHGIEVRDAWAGRRGESWEPPGVRYREKQLDALVERWAMEGCCREALEQVVRAWNRYVFRPMLSLESAPLPAADPELMRNVALALDHGTVLPAFLEYGSVQYFLDSEEMAQLSDALVAATPSRGSAAPTTLRGLARQARGDLAGAESDFAQALRLDPSEILATDALARIALDRSDVRRAAELESRLTALAGGKASSPLDEDVAAFLTSLASLTAHAGRNERCPCGSGRKFKACCLVNPRIPDDQLSTWLILKLHKHLSSPGNPGTDRGLDELEYIAQRAAGDGVGTYVVTETAAALIVEAWLFGGGIWDYLDRRGSLLPEAETEVLRAWADCPWGLYEVVDVEPGTSISLRDLRGAPDEPVIILSDPAYAGEAYPGAFLLAHVIPDRGSRRLFGPPVEVPSHRLEDAHAMLDAEADATAVAEWYGSLYRPPVAMEAVSS